MRPMNASNLSVQNLKRAVEIKEEVERLEAELAAILSGNAETGPATRGPRKISAAARAKIAAAQKARWAKAKGGSIEQPQSGGAKRRKLSPAAKAKIAAAAKARWKKAKAAGKKRL